MSLNLLKLYQNNFKEKSTTKYTFIFLKHWKTRMDASSATADIAQPIIVSQRNAISWVAPIDTPCTSISMAKLVRWEHAQPVWVRFDHSTWQPSGDQPLKNLVLVCRISLYIFRFLINQIFRLYILLKCLQGFYVYCTEYRSFLIGRTKKDTRR